MITGVILTHNEEHNVVDCATALRPHVGEILLVDTESTDRTVELAQPHVDKVLTYPHVPNFDAARNIAIPEAKYDWLWFVDADERIPELTGQIVNQWIREQGDEFDVINIPFKSYFCDHWMQHCGWWPGYTSPRVLRRGCFEFSKTLHGGVKHNGREIRFPPSEDTGIEHRSFNSVEHWIRKCNRYTSTESLQLAEQGVFWNWRQGLSAMVRDLWEHYEYHDAKLDGDRGWILTWLAGQYRWFSHAKLIDNGKFLEPDGGPSSVPDNLDDVIRAMEEELAGQRARFEPQIPFGLVWRCPVFASGPVADEARLWVKALARGTRHLVVEDLSNEETQPDAPVDAPLFRALLRGRRDKYVMTVSHGIEAVPPDSFSCFNVLRIPATVHSLSRDALRIVEAHDELWVHNESQRDELRRQGAAPERMRVVRSISTVDSQTTMTHSDIQENLEATLTSIESTFLPQIAEPVVSDQHCVSLEGEFFAGHSFSNINETLAREFLKNDKLALSLQRVKNNPTHDSQSPFTQELTPLFDRRFTEGPQVTIRHAFPAIWNRPTSGKWVHIQPWEFGQLPHKWREPLIDDVDEVWVMSRYVERVYRDSGVPANKIQYIPWGIDPDVFSPDIPSRQLPTKKTFVFLYVGGTIVRKGYDRVLEAYLNEFGPHDDVCLIVKDVGTRSFYSTQNLRDKTLAECDKKENPEIIYIDDEYTPDQLASLYAACNCYVAPYRGEGFGLPILEAVACGVPAIVPQGGATDDFLSTESAFFVPSCEVEVSEMTELCGRATELDVVITDVQAAMREAYSNPARTKDMGQAGSLHVRKHFTWKRTAKMMAKRIQTLCGADTDVAQCRSNLPDVDAKNSGSSLPSRLDLTVCVSANHDVTTLPDCLARVTPFVSEVIVVDDGEDLRTPIVAKEYGARVVNNGSGTICSPSNEWVLLIDANERVDSEQWDVIDSCLRQATPNTQAISICIVESGDQHSDRNGDPNRAVRFVRWPRDLSMFHATPSRIENMLTFDANTVICSDVIIARKRALTSSAKVVSDSVSAEGRASRNGGYGRLRKSVIIQSATGEHLKLLELTRDHHRAYAERLGMDYWCIAGNPAQGKRAGWGKIPLLIAGISAGYDKVVWLDADTVITAPDVDISAACQHGIGMVRHPGPAHWNSGVVVAKSSAEVEELLREVDRAPENNSAWMEQESINELAARAENRSLFVEIDIRYNSVPGFACAESPVIVAAHGLPMEQRVRILCDGLATLPAVANSQISEVKYREDFAEFLNSRNLLGEAVEVGVHKGEFSKLFLDCWQGKTLHLVDAWRCLSNYPDVANLSDQGHELCLQETKTRLVDHKGRYKIHRTLSVDAAQFFDDGSLDFVYIDANHSREAVIEDLRNWFPKVASGGVFAGHDYLDGELPEGNFGVKSAVSEFTQQEGLRVFVTDDAWPSWYLIRS